MNMYCNQCQEALKNIACTASGVCGKTDSTSNLQDLLVYVARGIALAADAGSRQGTIETDAARFCVKALFTTITNANFDDARHQELIAEGLAIRSALTARYGAGGHDALTWNEPVSAYGAKGFAVGVLADENEDIRSLKQLLILGLKGIAAYAHHAQALGRENPAIYNFLIEGLAATLKELPADEMTALVLRCGEAAVTTMALLDEANTAAYGTKEVTQVNIGVGANPGILISGHDLRDLEDLLKQTEGTGIDVYTHSEMLPAHYYPAFKKYRHFVGNYGNAWWQQRDEFESFNGPIVMTTNCLVPVRPSYQDRLFTTGVAAWPGVAHIADRPEGGSKDFSAVIARAKQCPPPTQLETGTIVGGFGHQQALALADAIIENIKNGSIKRFVVMAGCDGRQKERDYFTEVAQSLPKEAVILTAGCAKYRYNKVVTDSINGIPRVLDAGQCNDSYSLAVIALKLKEAFGLNDVNELPLSFDIAWYEQKAVTVLLALLHLGFKKIRLGPTLPAFISPGVLKVLVDTFEISGTGTVADDIEAIMAVA